MVFIEEVHGSEEAAKPLIVGPTTVYIHTNIRQIEVQDEREEGEEPSSYIEWVYDEYQYTKDEYIQLIAEENTQLKEDLALAQDALDTVIMDDTTDNRVSELEEQLAMTQEALDTIIMGE